MIALQFVFIYIYHVRQNLNIFHGKKIISQKIKENLPHKEEKKYNKIYRKKTFEICLIYLED